MERLQKVIAKAGIASRRKAEELIKQGLVKVNGQVVCEMGVQVDSKDVVTVNDKALNKEELVYFLLNKPRKYVSTVDDEHGRNKVTDLIDCEQRIFPVGRLDYDTTGMLILTNDGDFANTLSHPRFHIPKTYHVTVNGVLSKSDIYDLRNGVKLDDGTKSLPAEAKLVNFDVEKGKSTVDLTIYEGKYHQVKRMMEALGFTVTKLHRKSFGTVSDDQMPVGSYRRLRPHEIKTLKNLANQGKI